MAMPGHPRPPAAPPGPGNLQDPRELMPTLPRQLPSLPQAMSMPQAMPPPQPQAMPQAMPMPQAMRGPQAMPGAQAMPPRPMPGVPQTMLGPHIQAPSRRGSQVKKRSFFRPWMVIVAIVLAAAAAGVVVAMSGPSVAVQRSK